MDRIIQSPGKYIQGADVLTRLGDYLKPLANRWLVVGDKFVLGFAEETLRQSFKKAELHAEIAPFGGECSQNEIDRLKKLADSADCLAVLGIGGGKTLDTAKALAHFMNVPVAVAPTDNRAVTLRPRIATPTATAAKRSPLKISRCMWSTLSTPNNMITNRNNTTIAPA